MFKNKTVMVTGSNRGIGLQTLKKFAENGANLIAHARKRTPEFEQTIAEISEKYGVEVFPVYFDMTDTAEMKSEMRRVMSCVNSIDVLVNNAGVAHGGFFSMTKVQTIRDVFEVNLFSVMELTQIVLRKMTRQKSGAIVNMSSIAGMNIRPGNSAYGVSKAAVKFWTEILAAEVGQFGIRANAVAPGLTETDMAKQMEAKAGKEMLRQSALGRLAKPEEISNVVLFLASDKASFVNGHTVVVNGGGTAIE